MVWVSFTSKGPTVQPRWEFSPNNARHGPPEKCSLLYKPPYSYFQKRIHLTLTVKTEECKLLVVLCTYKYTNVDTRHSLLILNLQERRHYKWHVNISTWHHLTATDTSQSKFPAIFTTKFAQSLPQVTNMAQQQQEALGRTRGSLPRIYRGDNTWI